MNELIERSELSLAVVIGAGGMGAAVARRLAQRHRVLLADIDEARARNLAAILRDEGGLVEAAQCDVTDPASVDRMAGMVENRGVLGPLAHVAGLSPSAGDFDRIMRVNLTGPALVAEALLPHVRPGSAAILVASLAAHGFRGNDEARAILRHPTSPDLVPQLRELLGDANATPEVAYVYSKFGLLDYARRHVVSWGARGARILSLSPGMIATPMGAREFAHNEGKRRMFAMSPLKREGTMHEIADAVEFLGSDRASFITGTDILVDGGLAAAMAEN